MLATRGEPNHSYTAGVNARWYTMLGKQGSVLENSTHHYLRAAAPGHVSQRNENGHPLKNPHVNAHTSFILNGPMEKHPQCPSTSEWFNKVGTPISWSTTLQQREGNYWYTQHPRWLSRGLCCLEGSHSQKVTCCVNPLITHSLNGSYIHGEQIRHCPGGGGRREMRRLQKAKWGISLGMQMFYTLTVSMSIF